MFVNKCFAMFLGVTCIALYRFVVNLYSFFGSVDAIAYLTRRGLELGGLNGH